MPDPPPTIEQFVDLFNKSGLSERQPTYYEQLSLLGKIDYLHKIIKDEPRSNPPKTVIKRINDLKKELLKLQEHPEMLLEMLSDEMLPKMLPKMLPEMLDIMSKKISVLIKAITPKRSLNEMENNKMEHNENSNSPNSPNSKRTRGRTLS
jgi:hypothetical protein